MLTGNTLFALNYFPKKYKDYSVSLPLWGMKYKNLQISQARKFNEIITIEIIYLMEVLGVGLMDCFKQHKKY